MSSRLIDPLVINIESSTINNLAYRNVIHTGLNMQLTIMSLDAMESIDWEMHSGEQFIRVEKGSGHFDVKINNELLRYDLKDGVAFIVPSSTEHFIQAGTCGLKLYTIYSPPVHPRGTQNLTKDDT